MPRSIHNIHTNYSTPVIYINFYQKIQNILNFKDYTIPGKHKYTREQMTQKHIELHFWNIFG